MIAAHRKDGDRHVMVIVLSPDNLSRMKMADPITIDEAFGREISLTIAFEQDADTLTTRCADSQELMKYLQRGYKFSTVTGDGQLSEAKFKDEE